MKKILSMLLALAFIPVVSLCFLSLSSCRLQGKDGVAEPVSRVVTTSADRALADSLLGVLSAGSGRSVPELMLQAADALAGTPYVAGTLEGEEEALRIFLTRTDCIIFVETCLDLALTASECGASATFDDFAARVLRSRYRDGRAGRYSDRIHYTTEWLRAASARGELRDLTLELGGREYDHPIDYMSTHPDRYPALAEADSDPVAAEDLRRIRDVEAELNRTPCTYIPKADVPACLEGIRSGDILCFVTSVEGLDISHVALALVEDGRVGFIHASSAAGKVVREPSLKDYVARVKSTAGIKVLRP